MSASCLFGLTELCHHATLRSDLAGIPLRIPRSGNSFKPATTRLDRCVVGHRKAYRTTSGPRLDLIQHCLSLRHPDSSTYSSLGTCSWARGQCTYVVLHEDSFGPFRSAMRTRNTSQLRQRWRTGSGRRYIIRHLYCNGRLQCSIAIATRVHDSIRLERAPCL